MATQWTVKSMLTLLVTTAPCMVEFDTPDLTEQVWLLMRDISLHPVYAKRLFTSTNQGSTIRLSHSKTEK